MKKIDREVAVLFVLIGWAKAYDGKHRPSGNHRHFQEGGTGGTEAKAFLKTEGRFSCGVDKGRLHENAMDVVFIAKNPISSSYEVVGIYQNAKPVREDAVWSEVGANSAIAFKVGERPICHEWLKGQGMRRWAKRVDSRGKVHESLWKFYGKLKSSLALRGKDEEERTGLLFSDSDEGEFPEGRKIGRMHISKERSQELIKKTKIAFLQKHGKLFCQICGFDFKEKYGKHGDGYIEAHHTIPVSELKENSRSKMSDMALVCSNCHRMLHRRRPWLSLKELKDLLYDNPLLDFR